ncbi:hypothetical protein R3P38DRAFT_2593112 [Favolaschia claudopus]|uniref:Uncharacterized protein n=1 Tax=Favolaschia claudopus TaxID=2862362 RepID=A0AAW0EHE2_9AGAR
MPAGDLTVCDGLDQVKSLLKIVACLGDGAINVPCLKSVAGIALEIIDIAQTVAKNRRDAIEVAGYAAERTYSLIDVFKNKKRDDVLPGVLDDLEKYKRKLESVQKILLSYVVRPCILRRVIARFSDRDEINRCKDILNEAFQVFQISLTIKIYTRIPEMLIHLDAVVSAQAKAKTSAKFSIIRREELDLCDFAQIDGDPSVVFATYNGKQVLVKKYKDNKKWAADLDAWLDSDAWQPHYLQVIGQSEATACSLHLVFQDPGIPVQNFIEKECRDGVKKCSLAVLTMIMQFSNVASELLGSDSGGCKVETADVYLRFNSANAMNTPSFVLADFDPSHLYNPNANPSKIASNGWDAFVRLITKAIMGTLLRPNYVAGCHGATGPTVTRIFRFLIHFLVDFPYHQDRRLVGLDHLFKNLIHELKVLRSDIEYSETLDSVNPLLNSMERYSSTLCAIWDLWDILPIMPGDLVIMVPGADPKHPRFRKIANYAKEIRQWSLEQGDSLPVTTTFPEYAEQQYRPPGSEMFWSSESVDASTMRHSLRIGSIPADSLGIRYVYSRAQKISLLGNSWNYNAAWKYLRSLHQSGELSTLAAKHKVHPSDILLVFSTSESKGYTNLTIKNVERRDKLLVHTGAKDGVLHYFENLAATDSELHGYWSASEQPGNPLFGAIPRAAGPEWGWEYSEEGLNVEIGRKGPAQHIRYVSL